MAIEFVLYRVSDIQDEGKIKKTQQKLISQIEKIFDSAIEKETNEKLLNVLNSIKDRTVASIEKEIVSEAESIPICTVTNKKTYIEMPYVELEKTMASESCVIIGDDGSKYKSATALKKYYE